MKFEIGKEYLTWGGWKAKFVGFYGRLPEFLHDKDGQIHTHKPCGRTPYPSGYSITKDFTKKEAQQ